MKDIDEVKSFIEKVTLSLDPIEKANILKDTCTKFVSLSDLFLVRDKIYDDSVLDVSDSLLIQKLIEVGRDITSSIESFLEIVYSFEEEEDKLSNFYYQNEIINRILCDLANVYKVVALLTELYYKRNNSDKNGPIVSEAYLDLAIASKKAQNDIQTCVDAHLKRMELCHQYKITDVIRLLGLSSYSSKDKSDTKNNSLFVEERCNGGIFQANECRKEFADEDMDCYKSISLWKPSTNAIKLGMKSREIFIKFGYTLEGVTEILVHLIRNKSQNECQDTCRFYSANSFFNHRHELLTTNKDNVDEELFNSLPGKKSFKLLTYLFLFGIALKVEKMRSAIGDDYLKSLFDARLLRISPCCKNDIVAEYQIYPLHTNCFDEFRTKGDKSYSLFFMTDWPLESLRLPRDAIMAVGYDTLELMSISSGIKSFNTKSRTNVRVLDLCTGCGIQGISVAARWLFDTKQKKPNLEKNCFELICADINERAKNFVTGNVCLNGLSRVGEGIDMSSLEIFFLHSDVYEPLDGSNHNKTICVNSPSRIGCFDYILTNPPFVAVPQVQGPASLCPALYSVGGGVDGMNLLRKILIGCFKILENNTLASLLMVTELPNVEDSCELLSSIIGISASEKIRIRVTYVKEDVESIKEYARERENESGIVIESRDWSSSCIGIRNRALVLLSICKDRGDTKFKLGCYESKIGEKCLEYDVDIADGEDAFLTKKGINYTRNFIL